MQPETFAANLVCSEHTLGEPVDLVFYFFSGPALCQSWLQFAGMQLFLGRHSGTQSTVCRLTKAQQSQSEFNPDLLKSAESKHLLKLRDAGLRKV